MQLAGGECAIAGESEEHERDNARISSKARPRGNRCQGGTQPCTIGISRDGTPARMAIGGAGRKRRREWKPAEEAQVVPVNRDLHLVDGVAPGTSEPWHQRRSLATGRDVKANEREHDPPCGYVGRGSGIACSS